MEKKIAVAIGTIIPIVITMLVVADLTQKEETKTIIVIPQLQTVPYIPPAPYMPHAWITKKRAINIQDKQRDRSVIPAPYTRTIPPETVEWKPLRYRPSTESEDYWIAYEEACKAMDISVELRKGEILSPEKTWRVLYEERYQTVELQELKEILTTIRKANLLGMVATALYDTAAIEGTTEVAMRETLRICAQYEFPECRAFWGKELATRNEGNKAMGLLAVCGRKLW